SVSCCVLSFFFFFQAEDGIGDRTVTGFQTCALPISTAFSSPRLRQDRPRRDRVDENAVARQLERERFGQADDARLRHVIRQEPEIGRASCRERVESSGGAGAVNNSKT